AIERGLRLPLVYNTSAYDSLDSIELMDGVVDIYMPDFKFWDAEMARHYAKARNYPDAARRAIKAMHQQVGDLVLDENGLALRGLLLRHLVMPGGIVGTREIMEWVARELGPNTYVNVMAQYYPAGKVSAKEYGEINRPISTKEFEEALAAARAAGLHRLDTRTAARLAV
ncbi:MAG: radical SAM protein, partial [Terriglobia bacterium]